MKIYNTLSGRKEDFTVADERVKMYVCGITPYASSHVGHAMSAVIFDVIRRYLEFKGFTVDHVQNFTDIDDKMIAAAARGGISTAELAEQNISAFLNEMDTLNVQRAGTYPRATEEIPGIVDMVESLVDRGYAYHVNGDVYYRVSRDEDYGKLSRRSLDNMLAGARLEIDDAKEDAMDFALWKGQKPDEPAWDSPWGPGRPGWHIECSAMAMTYLGQTIDIHGGGRDLVFPHHENEIAQSESFSDTKPFARFWVHNGMLRHDDDKMSKSLGNFVTLSECLQRFSPDALRLFFMSSHYRGPLTYTDEAVEAQERGLGRLLNAMRPAEAGSEGDPIDTTGYRDRFVEAMNDDFNTPRAVACLFDLARDINRGTDAGQNVREGQAALKSLAGILGLTLEANEDRDTRDSAPFIELLIETRKNLRAAGQYELADSIRDRLGELDISLEDTPQGTLWKSGRA